jgi:hypothetical protein
MSILRWRARPPLVITWNNAGGRQPCAWCRHHAEPWVELWVFPEGTWSPVCFDCGLIAAPEVVAALSLVVGAGGFDAIREELARGVAPGVTTCKGSRP